MKIFKAIFIVFLILFIIGLGLSFLETQPKIRQASFSYFLQLLQKNEIKKIEIIGENILFEDLKGNLYQTAKEENLTINDIFKLAKIDFKSATSPEIIVRNLASKNLLWNVVFAFLPLVFVILLFWYFLKQAQRGAGQIFSFVKSGIKIYNPQDKNKITFKDVAGLEEAKEELKEIVEFLKNPQKFIQLGARIPKGVILVGPPGSGKTLLARAVAGESNVPFFHISGSEFVELFVGVGASRVRDAFALAKKNAPSILFIDEIDAVGRMRGAGIGGGHDEREQTLNQILVEMDGFDKETKVIVLAATNRPDILDPALLRPGRFDRRIILELPTVKEREEILKIHLKDKKVSPKVKIRKIAERTPGFSGADLANLTNEAAILAARRGKKEITQRELLDAIEKVILGPEKKSRVYSKREKEISAYHEAGHALIAHYLKYPDPVEKISIISRGRIGGYTLKLPLEEKHFHFRKEFLDEIAVLLGGYTAELLIFDDISTGASNDLKVATKLARDLITRYGMSEKFGPITFSRIEETVFLGKELIVEKDYSEETAREIDEEVQKILTKALQRAKTILENKKEKLNLIANTLIKKETIERRQFEKLIKDPKGSFPVEI